MAAPSVYPTESFSYLVQTLPQWLSKLEELKSQCDKQYERFYKLTKHGEVKLTRQKKHNSTESLRPKDDVTISFLQIENVKDVTPIPLSITEAVTEATETPQSTTPRPVVLNPRPLKRKPASALSAASGKDGYRTKSMTVVYYDSAIQAGFENIVKNVSNARSSLRKGRTAATFQARMVSMGLPSDITDTCPSAKIILPSFGGRRMENASEKQKFRVYDDVDRDLEEAQKLSERAAHQFLRDGDCKIEMEATKKRLQAVLEMAEKELQRLKDEEDSPEQVEPTQAASEKGIEQILDRDYPTVSMPLPPSDPIEVEVLSPKHMHFVATGAIEVDDSTSDTNSIKIDMNAIRRISRGAA